LLRGVFLDRQKSKWEFPVIREIVSKRQLRTWELLLLMKVKEIPVAVFHGRDGKWVAAHGICPHKNGSIIDSIYGNGKLTCPLHSYSFDIQTGACDNPDIGSLKIFDMIIRDERVLIKI
jgi:nitrite reductase/ring-hydroxylating ferredoxin subunit